MRAGKFESEQLLTSSQVGELLQVNASSVKNWVNEGRIRAFQTPGGHRRIRVADLLAFLDQHNMPLPTSLAGHGKRRLLIIDDDARQLRALKRLLDSHEDRVETSVTTSGIDALLLVGSFKPHLIVLDVFMPGLDGLEVCRRLKLRAETEDIDVVVTSGQSTDSLKQRALSAGACCFLEKPLDVSLILQQLGILDDDRSRRTARGTPKDARHAR